MSQTSDIKETFFQECEELIDALGDGLRILEASLGEAKIDSENINAVFRSVHSIKGGAGAFGLEALVRFAHLFETVLDEIRSDRMQADEALLQLFHRSGDHLSDLINMARRETTIPTNFSIELSTKLADLLGTKARPDDNQSAEDFGFTPTSISFDIGEPYPSEAELPPTGFYITFEPKARMYELGHDPIILFHCLAELGELEVSLDMQELPPLGKLVWSESYFKWSLKLTTTETELSVQEVFEFVDGLCDLKITPILAAPLSPPLQLADPAVVSPMAKPAKSGAAVQPSENAAPPRATVRVELERIDRLINLVGELVINQAMLTQCVYDAKISPRSNIGTGLDEFRNLAREIQESVMAIRAQPIKPLFQRMSRIIREASDTASKKVRFETLGELTEVDKTVIERLADPLTHMIRNAVDHGIEAPEKRMALGKSEIGTITLSAAHRSGRVVIEVSDNGGGINREKVLKLAVSKGLVASDAILADQEIDKLLFLPGFSTASSISDLSGRGVGMDVVRSAIQALGGRTTISSVPGKGTVFSISLPLTLAVLDGMVVDVEGQTMVLPITAIVETIAPDFRDIHSIGPCSDVLAIRGVFIPIIDLAQSFDCAVANSDKSGRVLLVVETEEKAQFALAVNSIIDQRQVVIKGLEDNYGHVPGVAAATILGDGKIALIIDVEETIAMATANSQAPAQLMEV